MGSPCDTSSHCDSGLICDQGVCNQSPGGMCTVLTNNCRPDQSCQLTSTSPEQGTCEPVGNGGPGDACGVSSACTRGDVCMTFQGVSGARCYAPCNSSQVQGGTCPSNEACLPVTGLSFGICMKVDCSPFTCPSGDTCALTEDLVNRELIGCRPAGTAAAGAACDTEACAAPGFCIDLGTGKKCIVPCDGAHACATGMCIYLAGVSFGGCQ
jgi:hypothetical protein